MIAVAAAGTSLLLVQLQRPPCGITNDVMQFVHRRPARDGTQTNDRVLSTAAMQYSTRYPQECSQQPPTLAELMLGTLAGMM
jgi:hypothetical protein